MSQEPLTVGMIGLGTVGSGVASLLLNQSERLSQRTGRAIRLKRIAVKDLRKKRSVSVPDELLTDDVHSVIQDPEIDVVIQLIGGLEPAESFLIASLREGKDVVTANKALICERGQGLFRIAREQGRCIAFEAAVAGGVPIIAAVGSSLASNQIQSIQAILNGTSNFILSEMISANRSYAEAVAMAQELGYAEADPTMDVDGTDAAQKLVILTQLAFGTHVGTDRFTSCGIDGLDLVDLQFAQELGYTVKLLATAKLEGNRLAMHVEPSLVPIDRMLASCDGPFNMIAVEGDAVGKAWFSGPGAGQLPTASAVVADLIDIAVGRTRATFPRLDIWGEQSARELLPAEELTRRYFLRFLVEDRPHVFADITDVLGRHNISLASVIQHEVPETEELGTDGVPIVPLVIMTHRTREGALRRADEELASLSCLRSPRVRLPIAD